MNLRRFLALFKMDVKKTYRQPAFVFLLVLFPMILTVAFGAAFGSMGSTETTYTIAVVNNDGVPGPWSEALIRNMSQNQILNNVTYADEITAKNDLVQGKIDAILVIPVNFSESCDSYWSDPLNPSSWINVTVSLEVDQGSLVATQAIPPIIQQLLIETLLGEGAGTFLSPIGLGTVEETESSQSSQFDIMVPGLFAFASIFMTMTVAQSIMDEKEKGLIRRIYVTPMDSSDFVLSHGVANMLFAALQTGIILLFATLFGFKPDVGVASYLMVFLIVLIFAICNVGFGLIVASIAKSSGTATGLSFIFIIPQMFLGTYVPVPESVGRFVPSFYVTDAVTSLFIRGAPVSSPTILTDLLIISAISIITFIIGIFVFKKFGKN